MSKRVSPYFETEIKAEDTYKKRHLYERAIQNILAVSECRRCILGNRIENRYSSQCGYPPIVTTFEEMKEVEDIKIRIFQDIYET